MAAIEPTIKLHQPAARGLQSIALFWLGFGRKCQRPDCGAKPAPSGYPTAEEHATPASDSLGSAARFSFRWEPATVTVSRVALFGCRSMPPGLNSQFIGHSDTVISTYTLGLALVPPKSFVFPSSRTSEASILIDWISGGLSSIPSPSTRDER